LWQDGFENSVYLSRPLPIRLLKRLRLRCQIVRQTFGLSCQGIRATARCVDLTFNSHALPRFPLQSAPHTTNAILKGLQITEDALQCRTD
jgi:hypothetical protein